MVREALDQESTMINSTFKRALAAAALAIPLATAATTDAFAWGHHYGGGGWGHHHHGGGGWGGGRRWGGGWGGGGWRHHHHGWGYRPRYVYTGGYGCGWGRHWSNYWGRCVPNRPYY
jgi:hypothetical protein